MNDKQRFGAVLAAACEIHNRELTESMVRIYLAALNDLPLDACIRALERLVGTSKFMPKPAEIRELVVGDVTDRALVSWGEVLTLASNSAAAKHADPDVETAVRAMGGWRRIGMANRDQLGYLQREFRDHFQAVTSRKAMAAIGNDSGQLIALNGGASE